MKKIKKKYLCLLVVCITLCINCQIEAKRLPYKKMVRTISKRVVDLTYTLKPLMYNDFKPIYKNPQRYLDSAINFVSQDSYNETEFGVVLLSMHKLSQDSYLKLLSVILKVYKEGKITDGNLITSLNGTFANKQMMRHASNHAVHKRLVDLSKDQNVSKKVRDAALKILKM